MTIETIESIRAAHPVAFEHLCDHIRNLGTDSLEVFKNGYTHEGGYALQQNPHEMASLLLFLKWHNKSCGTFMEIGSGSGGTARLLQEYLGFRKFVSLDDGQHPRASEQITNFNKMPMVRQLICDSHSPYAKDFIHSIEDLDVVLVDGDHSYEGVVQDVATVLWSKNFPVGGLVILHDVVACDGPNRAWNEAISLGFMEPLATFFGDEVPLGIAVGAKR